MALINIRTIKITVISIVFVMFGVLAQAATINKFVAVVNDEVITQQDVDQLLAVLYAQYSQEYKGDELLQKMEQIKKDILNQIIEDKLVLSRAKELGIKVAESEINERLDYIKNGFSSEDDFYKTLETQGVTIANLKDRYRDQIMMKKLVDYEVKSKISVLPSETNDYYEKHKDQFRENDKYRVKNILIKAKDEVSFELARVEMENIYNKLKEGENFDDLAKQYSQGPNAEKGGAMGYIEQGQMLEVLDKAIFKLKPGEFSEPVKSEIGYHVFKTEDIKYGKQASLEDVQKNLQMIIFQDKFKAQVNEWLSNLKKKAYISIK
ncbi:MAG: peptidylprolyl isomerase [Candidatus Omnitrophica bacterium]|nr:peptidylprolyl isomerase [Candidatus Omnitrophota bacterium]